MAQQSKPAQPSSPQPAPQVSPAREKVLGVRDRIGLGSRRHECREDRRSQQRHDERAEPHLPLKDRSWPDSDSRGSAAQSTSLLSWGFGCERGAAGGDAGATVGALVADAGGWGEGAGNAGPRAAERGCGAARGSEETSRAGCSSTVARGMTGCAIGGAPVPDVAARTSAGAVAAAVAGWERRHATPSAVRPRAAPTAARETARTLSRCEGRGGFVAA